MCLEFFLETFSEERERLDAYLFAALSHEAERLEEDFLEALSGEDERTDVDLLEDLFSSGVDLFASRVDCLEAARSASMAANFLRMISIDGEQIGEVVFPTLSCVANRLEASLNGEDTMLGFGGCLEVLRITGGNVEGVGSALASSRAVSRFLKKSVTGALALGNMSGLEANGKKVLSG